MSGAARYYYEDFGGTTICVYDRHTRSKSNEAIARVYGTDVAEKIVKALNSAEDARTNLVFTRK